MNKILLLLLLTSCGINVHVDPVETQPIEVKHTFTVDYDLVNSYCNTKCSSASNDQAAIKTCTDDCFHSFLDVLTHVTGSL